MAKRKIIQPWYILYRLTFPNGKLYFGITGDLTQRWGQHRRRSMGKGRRLLAVHRAIRKFGAEQIVVEALVVGALEYICALEIAAIARFGTMKRTVGYNLAPGGELSPTLNPEVAKYAGERKRGIRTPAMLAALAAARAKIDLKAMGLATAERVRNLVWINDGQTSLRVVRGSELPDGWQSGRAPRSRKWSPKQPRIPSAETIQRLTKTLRDWWSDPANRRRGAANMGLTKRGKRWITDGISCRQLASGKAMPDGWKFGMAKRGPATPAQLANLSKGWELLRTDPEAAAAAQEKAHSKQRGKVRDWRWITNGITEKSWPRSEPIPDGWQPGTVRPRGGREHWKTPAPPLSEKQRAALAKGRLYRWAPNNDILRSRTSL